LVPLPSRARVGGRSRHLRGWAVLAMSVRMFFIAIVVLAIAALAFLIATA
jgi:hypothetical protein